jgi:hypothetical protein
MLSDTHPEAEKLQIELLRRLTPAQRFAKACALTQWTRDLSRRAIGRAFPNLSPEQQKLKFIEVHYGKELAEQVRQYLSERVT